MPAALTLAFAQLPPATSENTELVGNWSFVPTSVVAPSRPPGLPAASSTASITAALFVVVLFAVFASFVAPIVPPNVIAGVASWLRLEVPVVVESLKKWELEEPDALLASGDAITIRRAALGSFLMNTAQGRTHRVHRLH